MQLQMSWAELELLDMVALVQLQVSLRGLKPWQVTGGMSWFLTKSLARQQLQDWAHVLLEVMVLLQEHWLATLVVDAVRPVDGFVQLQFKPAEVWAHEQGYAVEHGAWVAMGGDCIRV